MCFKKFLKVFLKCGVLEGEKFLKILLTKTLHFEGVTAVLWRLVNLPIPQLAISSTYLSNSCLKGVTYLHLLKTNLALLFSALAENYFVLADKMAWHQTGEGAGGWLQWPVLYNILDLYFTDSIVS